MVKYLLLKILIVYDIIAKIFFKDKYFVRQKIHLGMRDMGLGPYHWRSINGSFSLCSEPTILLLPGANINLPKQINGTLKIISEFVSPEKPTRLVGVYYDKLNIEAHKTYMQYEIGELTDSLVATYNQNQMPDVHAYCSQFFNQYLKNIFYDNNNVRSVSDIQNQLKNLTIMAHCYGSLIAFELERLMLKEMNEIGFSTEECLQIQKSLTVINFASRAPIGQFNSSTVHILSSADDLWLENWKKESFYTFFQQRYLLSAKQDFYKIPNKINGSLLSFSDNEILFFVPKVSLEQGCEHRVSSYIKTKESQKRITQNIYAIDMFVRLFVSQKRQDADYTFKNHITNWKNTPEGYVFCKNGLHQMQEYQNYLKKCRIGRTLLHQCVENENLEEVNALINYWEIPIDLTNKDGCFALLTAVQKQNIEMVKLFLNKMSYNEVMNMRSEQQDKLFFRTVLNTENNDLIKEVYTVLMHKNKRWCLLECQPLLQDYCLQQTKDNKNVTDILPVVFDLNNSFVTMGDILKTGRFYQAINNIKTPIVQQTKNTLLKIILTCSQKEVFFDANEQGHFIVPVLKAEDISPVFINTVISARKNYIRKLMTEKLPQIINQAINKWNKRSELSKLLCVFSSEKALKETLYLNRVSDYILLDGVKTSVAKRIEKRLNKRYSFLLNQILLNETKQRV